MTYRPKGRIETRTWVLALVLLDCGLRISEALTLERDKADLDSMVLRVRGWPDVARDLLAPTQTPRS